MRANCLLMLLRASSAVALLPVASRVGVKSLPAIARRGKGTASLLTVPQSPASVLFPRLARRSMTVRACMSPEEVVAAVDAQGKEVRRLKDEGLGNKSPEVSAAVTELLRLKALLPPEEGGAAPPAKEQKKAKPPAAAPPAAAKPPAAPLAPLAPDVEGASVDRTPRTRVNKLLTQGEAAVGSSVVLKGWVRTVRKQKSFSFVELNDGSTIKSVQVIAPGEMESYGVAEALSTGAAIAQTHGSIHPHPHPRARLHPRPHPHPHPHPRCSTISKTCSPTSRHAPPYASSRSVESLSFKRANTN